MFLIQADSIKGWISLVSASRLRGSAVSVHGPFHRTLRPSSDVRRQQQRRAAAMLTAAVWGRSLQFEPEGPTSDTNNTICCCLSLCLCALWLVPLHRFPLSFHRPSGGNNANETGRPTVLQNASSVRPSLRLGRKGVTFLYSFGQIGGELYLFHSGEM